MKYREWATMLCAMMLWEGRAFAQGNLITNGSFESYWVNYGSVSHFSSIPGWHVTRGCTVEIQNHIGSGWQAADGHQLVELDSYCPTTIAQSISTMPGTQYLLSFAYSPRPGNADNRVRVRWGGSVVAELTQSGTGLSDARWATISIPLNATSSWYLLEFEDTSYADGLGGFIDNVQLSAYNSKQGFH